MTATHLPAGLMLVHGNYPETLRDLLLTWMKRYPLAPLENEVILVQSNGIAQWLKLALAADVKAGEGDGESTGGCGIAAALDISLPSSFLWQAYRAVLGREAVPEASPFDKSRLLWRLMRLLPDVMTQPVYAPLQRFLDNDSDRRKRFQLAERLADLFDQYQVYRADWLAAWASGEDVLIEARGGRPSLPDEQRWQAALWRALLADVGADNAPAGGRMVVSNAGRAAVHAAFMQAAGAWPQETRPPGLPRRVMVFGISALPRQSLEVLAMLARWTQVLMCVHNPCEHYWADIVADRDLLGATQARQTRRNGVPEIISEELLHLHAHPLLAAWGKQGRDFIGLLDEHDSDAARANYLPHFTAIGQRIDLFDERDASTLLHQLQDDIRALRPLNETCDVWPAVDPARDSSIRFHLAHSAQREVEILHDQLLAAFNADASLLPRDIVVMVPDIDTYAPHIQAVFGLLEVQDQRYIPFSLADQGRRHSDPLAQALEKLIGLPQLRFAASDLLDLLEVPALRLRFGIAEENLPLLHRWIRGSNIRWGLHAEQRASLDLPAQPEPAAPNTWLFGLRRMLLGYAVGAKATDWQAIEPYDEIGGLDAALLGPLVHLLDRLDATWRILREPAPVSGWCARLRALMADFFLAEESGDAYTLQQLDSALQRWLEACDEAALNETLPLSVVGDYWLSQLDEGGLSQRFFAGAVTFATLMPMRAIPFRHVCLLGMNDGDYPRTRVPMDFDLMGKDYRPGDRSRREDDRYLFLEALLSARDSLHISWVGRSINDNTTRPPSVLIGQLRDHFASGWKLAGFTGEATKGGEALLAALTVEHRLQPFSPDYFRVQPNSSPLFTYAHEWRNGAELPREAVRSTAGGLLPPLLRDEPLSVRDLASFLKDPVKTFFRQRLNVSFERDDPASEDQEPFELDGLGNWKLQDELIRAQENALLDGKVIETACAAQLARIHRRGELAAGGFGEYMAATLAEPMPDLFERYQAALLRWPRISEGEEEIRFSADIDGQTLDVADWLGGIRMSDTGERGRVVLETSNLVDKTKHYRGDKMIRHWVTHLASHLAGGPLTTMIVSLKGEIELKPMAISEAEAHLKTLLAAWQLGMRRPLPLAAKTAFAWLKVMPAPVKVTGGTEGTANAAERRDGEPAVAPPFPVSTLDKAMDAARQAYEGGYRQQGEVDTCAYLQRAYPDFDALFADGEFAELAESLLRPLQRAIPAERKKADKPAPQTDAGVAA
ncbi:exodeoxyribonuclease V subunit gamma [Propionivibrio sp.]|uniref:exodeoxyribonuclease V subunit gamma n=1 Tax=Propionivibrio sp. TaxID=2212460 RepID=UPI003BF140DE